MKVAHHSFLEEVSDDQVSPEGGYSTPDILCRQSRPKHPPPYQSFNFNFGQPRAGVLGTDLTSITPGAEVLGTDLASITPGAEVLGMDLASTTPERKCSAQIWRHPLSQREHTAQLWRRPLPAAEVLGTDVASTTPGATIDSHEHYVAITPSAGWIILSPRGRFRSGSVCRHLVSDHSGAEAKSAKASSCYPGVHRLSQTRRCSSGARFVPGKIGTGRQRAIFLSRRFLPSTRAASATDVNRKSK